MKNLNFYIAYLLTKHECVIVPGLGAFIASSVDADDIKKAGLLCPPAQTLGFNPEIKHNDGLLANAVAKGEKISYKEACLQIVNQAALLNKQLAQQKTVSIAWIGQLTLSPEHKIIFTPSIHLSCNASHFGLNNFYLPTLDELDETIEIRPISAKKEKIYLPHHWKVIRRYASVAAAVLAFFLISTPLNKTSQSNIQQASFIPVPTLLVETPAVEIEPDTTTSLEETVNPTQKTAEIQQLPQVEEADTRYYYIVIASLPTRDLAQQQAETYHRRGFSSADVVSKDDKHRVYISKFADKPVAEDFLNEFRELYPEHSNAWLLSQR
ncbi:cell division protein [Bacteroidia bacterium]|nr:cell division protein [Bacteroidia bacterium]